MDDGLRRLIRERYLFPIAHAHKKLLSFLHDDAHKLTCLIQTAEVTIQFLALVVLAQLHRDLEHGQAPELGSRGASLRDDLRNPSFGKWLGMLRDVLKQYDAQRHLLVMPELFDFAFQPSRGKTLRLQPVVTQAIEPLIKLRNDFHHPGIPDFLIPEKLTVGMGCLEQLLAGVQFLSAYQLAFIQRIELLPQTQPPPHFGHELLQMGGCFTTFDRQLWESEVFLQARRLILLATDTTRPPLFLDPFVTCAEQLRVGETFVAAPGVFEVFLLNGTATRRARYLAAQSGGELPTDQSTWAQGAWHVEALGTFFERLRRVPVALEEVRLEEDGQASPTPVEETSDRPTGEVFATRYQRPTTARQFTSPYKFLDYFTPEDADLFYGREQEIGELQRKFHRARLLVLHGESGTGKTSLIRAGLIPRLAPESYVPVYVRAVAESTQAIKEEMIRQLGVDRRHIDLPLAAFLDAETAYLSKTVVLILDQFEEFFLRFPPEVRQLLHRELGACVAAAHLDVHIIISLREDYFSALAEFQTTIPDIFTHEMRLARLTQAQALQAAVEPVKRVGLSIDETLVAGVILPLLDQEGHGIEPPLLQIVCDAMYQHAQNAGRTAIGSEDYNAIGDVQGALRQYLERTLRQFGTAQPQARTVLKSLVTSAGTKQAVFLDELAARVHTLGGALTPETLRQDFLRPLVQARLVRAEEVEGRRRYELVHEYLVQQIVSWIAEHERELTKVRELLDRAYEGYRATGLLLEPGALAVITPYAAQVVAANETEKRDFLARSRQAVRRQWWGGAAQGRSAAPGGGSRDRWRAHPAVVSVEPTTTSGTRRSRGQCHPGQTSPYRVLYRAGAAGTTGRQSIARPSLSQPSISTRGPRASTPFSPRPGYAARRGFARHPGRPSGQGALSGL
jgi:hypothetical protein